uniref:Uncharacterized protein n=1 Tax=Candidatus Kentrum sp. SD TaxID=2126332 RepID=A0A450YGE8_9GAMM|nr:MAG: hypothetical protein BECKSD772F_GA0070984_106318 [Candidatus Kentron sp. SD]VFK45687.1 MAG: hypothetical protein BECKSD772E_GA0070983_105818 [Candidatus Kentron sp. SD]
MDKRSASTIFSSRWMRFAYPSYAGTFFICWGDETLNMIVISPAYTAAGNPFATVYGVCAIVDGLFTTAYEVYAMVNKSSAIAYALYVMTDEAHAMAYKASAMTYVA